MINSTWLRYKKIDLDKGDSFDRRVERYYDFEGKTELPNNIHHNFYIDYGDFTDYFHNRFRKYTIPNTFSVEIIKNYKISKYIAYIKTNIKNHSIIIRDSLKESIYEDIIKIITNNE